jgi:hypothetical protein
VSQPIRVVKTAHFALGDILAIKSSKPDGSDDVVSASSRIPKELLHTCIRPVLLQLKEYTRLTVPLLRGLFRLLTLLGSLFNKTLSERLLDHLRKWTDPTTIIGHKVWVAGEEPLVAAAIIDIFSVLPSSAPFIEHLVKTCIKLESTFHLFKSRLVEQPYRRPLARYLNKHAQYAAGFFFPRLKTPMYSELFQHVIQLDESIELREYISTKQCSDLLLHLCFERPLAIIRAEKTVSGDAKSSLTIHGIGKETSSSTDYIRGSLKPMNTEALEMQHQGLRLINTLMLHNSNYLHEHSDIVRASRWLWRSRGRLLRQQYEECVSPRFQDESKLLAMFRMSYAKSFPNEAIDIIFELFRVFLQPSTLDFGFVSRYLIRMVTEVLNIDQKKKVLSRFFISITGDTNEEIKVLGIQFLVVPMLERDCKEKSRETASPENLDEESSCDKKVERRLNQDRIIDEGVLKKFILEVLFLNGSPISCGSRLSFELLRLLNYFVENNASEILPFQNDVVQYCWSSLKSENMTCRCWSYVVLCRLTSFFDTPSKIVRRLYFSLLKMQEERKLVRAALDLLVPALCKRLDGVCFKQTIDETIELLSDEGISVMHLAQITQTIIRNPDIFEVHSSRIASLFVSNLHRLGLQLNGSIENRFLAVNAIELTLIWADKQESEIGLLLSDNAAVLTNFLIRIKLMVSEAAPDTRAASHFEMTLNGLDVRVQSLLDTFLLKYDVKIKISPFEKLIGRDRNIPDQLLSCLEIITKILKFRYVAFFHQNVLLFQNIVDIAVESSRHDCRLQGALRIVAIYSKASNLVSTLILAAFDKAILKGFSDQTKADRTSDPARRQHIPIDMADASAFNSFALEVIADLCKDSCSLINIVGTTLLAVVRSLSKQHLSDAAAKIRHSASTSVRATNSGIKYPTATIGILEEAVLREKTALFKYTKNRHGDEANSKDTPIRTMIVALSIFERSDFVYTFSELRKSLLQIISNILESSDNVQLILIAVRIVGKWLLSKSPGCPLTINERIAFLERIN